MSVITHRLRREEHESSSPGTFWPFDLRINTIAGFLNCELVDHPVYDGLELQIYDDSTHGTGMLAFLSRRADRKVDYYHEPGLNLDPISFSIGGGTGAWNETTFEEPRLDISRHGVDAEVRFTDIDGRLIEIQVDDRTRKARRRGDLLAPISAAVEQPASLMVVWIHQFDLARKTSRPPVIRIDGSDVHTGSLPGVRLHRHLLIKYGGPLCAVEMNRKHDGALEPRATTATDAWELTPNGQRLAAVTTGSHDHGARLSFNPPVSDLFDLPQSTPSTGTWAVEVDTRPVTGGHWSATREKDRVELTLTAEERWQPGRLPLLMALVTRTIPVFRRWPTTYRWTATVDLGPTPTMRSGWERTRSVRDDSYRRATGSAP